MPVFTLWEYTEHLTGNQTAPNPPQSTKRKATQEAGWYWPRGFRQSPVSPRWDSFTPP